MIHDDSLDVDGVRASAAGSAEADAAFGETAPAFADTANASASGGSADAGPAAPGQAKPALDDLQDRLLRVTAEFDNYRKRTERERRDLWDSASSDVIRDFLPVLDDLERALSAPIDATAAESMRRGVELIHRQMLELLKKRGVQAIDAVGQMFDPHVHEAVANEPASGRADGEITAELRRGYRQGERLLRASVVRVAKS
jgi:molecular chaperone GrpE